MKQNGVRKMSFKNVKVLGVTSVLALITSCSSPSNFEAPTLTDNETSTSVFGGEKLPNGVPQYIFAFTGSNGIDCHGTRISDNYILSAAHCFKGTNQDLRRSLARVNKNGDITYYRNSIVNVTIHPKYQERESEIDNNVRKKGGKYYAWQIINNYDLALVKIKPELLPSNEGNPVSLRTPLVNIVPSAIHLGIRTAHLYSMLNHKSLKRKNEDSAENRKLEIYLKNHMNNDLGNMFIMDEDRKISLCDGDSGAGLFIADPFNPGVVFLIGIVVGGPSLDEANGQCTNFCTLANVAMSSDWISEALSK